DQPLPGTGLGALAFGQPERAGGHRLDRAGLVNHPRTHGPHVNSGSGPSGKRADRLSPPAVKPANDHIYMQLNGFIPCRTRHPATLAALGGFANLLRSNVVTRPCPSPLLPRPAQ